MKIKSLLKAATILAVSATGVSAGEDSVLSVEGGQSFVTTTAAPAHLEDLSEIYSGWVFRTDETQELQMDDFDNPGFVFVDQAIDLFAKVEGTEGLSCSSCHSDVAEFTGLRAQMPRVVDGKLQSMEELINSERVNRMGAEPWKWNSTQMISMTALVSLQSRGMPVDVAIDGEAAPFWEQGKEIYYARVGQLDFSCANCHEDNYGNMIRADHLSQGQINGFPTYRLNSKLNSTHARFSGCMKNVRATPYKVGSDEFKALELYLASRGNGLSIESPSVRN